VKDNGNAVTAYGDRIHKSLELRLRDNTSLDQESGRYEALCSAIEKHSLGADDLTTEEEMTLNQQLEPTGWWDDDAWLRSKIDVLVRRGDRAYMFDWKTGTRRPDFDQLELFAVQVFKHYPAIERVKTSFVWLKEAAMDSQTYTRDQAPAIWTKILAKIQRIEKSMETGNWPARPSGLCRWCPCNSFCQYARR
ncbi:PD-(D/E)XK nuclease family protein, partial [Arthrospira platensis SPKY2]